MSRWLQSGRRRDVCILLAGTDQLTAQQLKTRLERRYDERIEPQSFYAALDELERLGHVESHVEGLADAYSLTEAGERLVRAQYEWMRERVEDERADGD
ncbi:PadR family transcriptional regulator [Haloarculaceae archaeon H-GB2-1]|nr:PadR family transcriptional regulator [Haloarculaceae archaeon H-GB1-1]MEA5387552.1 PadR family transcriptional regulator [Haloarculaceae archaeon H-GB11]MEA5409034.1 PadR family transcriptional regulator [Haloarculaceae archaeon H-GB2-1]